MFKCSADRNRCSLFYRPGSGGLLAGLVLGGILLMSGDGGTAPTRRDLEFNGPRLNGVELAPPGAAAPNQGKLSLLEVSLQSGVVLASGTVVRDAALVGTKLQASGRTDDWKGALLTGEASDHRPLRLRIDGITTAADPKPNTPDNENSDVLAYELSYQWGEWKGAGAARTWSAGSEWTPLCPSGAAAIPIAGRWNYMKGQRGDSGRVNSDRKVVTFACRGSAIAKCIEVMGYKPWLAPRQPTAGGAAVSVEALHQACVRAVRADYCGNGDSLTSEGQTINFYDSTGLLNDTDTWEFEAAWSPQGASCVGSTRLLQHPEDRQQTVKGYIAKNCLQAWTGPACDAKQKGALLFTERKPAPPAP
jgi:hypothetical protein